IIIVVCDNPQKDTLFSAQKRAEIIRENTQHFSDVEVTIWRGLLVDFLEEEGINLIIRGLRATSDFEEEFQMALMNKKLNKDIETIMLVSDAKYNYLSSSSVKEVFQFDGCISGLVP
ncbi:pantetheine-phosphate adenylyltransferase, partial [Halanaerobaculum tunisiense]